MNGGYEWFYHFNPFTGLWAAFKDKDRSNYVSKRYPHAESKAIFATDITDLIEVISRGGVPSHEDSVYKQYGLEQK